MIPLKLVCRLRWLEVMATFAIKIILFLGLVFYSGGPLETAWRAVAVDEEQEVPVEQVEVVKAIPPCVVTAEVDCDATRMIIPVSWPLDRASSMKKDEQWPAPQVLSPKPRARVEGRMDCPSLASAGTERDMEQHQALKVSCTRLQQTAAEFFLTYRGSTQ
mgnify:CR=1 FL=1